MELEQNEKGVWNYLFVVENHLYVRLLEAIDAGEYEECRKIIGLLGELCII